MSFLPGVLRSGYFDLAKAENLVTSSPDHVDYLIVRPVGVDPDEQPVGSWRLANARSTENIGVTVAKEDVAKFMLQEALQPSLHRQAITIGHA